METLLFIMIAVNLLMIGCVVGVFMGMFLESSRHE
jgi:hypothetical protein